MPTDAELRQPISTIPFVVLESANNTLTELQFNLPVSIESNLGVLIRQIRFHADGIGVVGSLATADTATFTNEVDAAVSLVQGLATIPTLGDARTIAAMHILIGVASAPADAGAGLSVVVFGEVWDYGPSGLLVMDTTLSVYLVGSGLAGVNTLRGQLMYQMVRVTAQEAISFAVRSLG